MRVWYKKMFGGFAAILILSVYSQTEAWALVTDDPVAPPPSYPPCTGSSVQLHPGMNGNSYDYSGRCWINLAADKYDQDHPSWVNAPVTGTSSYDSKKAVFNETVTFSGPSGPITLSNTGWCDKDPWLTPEDCTLDPQTLRFSVINAVGLDIGNNDGHRGPLGLIVISPTLISQLISKQESKPPRPPVNVDPVIWSVDNGKSTRVTVTWKAGDMSNNRWVMQFNIQLSQQKTDSDSAYSNAGQVLGLGPKQTFSASDTSRVYVFTLPNEVQPIDSYYFRICALNDSDSQCSTPVQARKPTKQEMMSHVGSMHIVGGALSAPAGKGTPATMGTKPTNPATLGAARSAGTAGGGGGSPTGANNATGVGLASQKAPTALGTGGSGVTGSGGATPAGSPPTAVQAPRVFGAALIAKPGGATGTGGSGSGGATGGTGGSTGSGGATPGSSAPGSAKSDLAVAPEGMLLNDQKMAWSATKRLVLHPDASHTCPVRVSFRYTNLGKAATQNVVAELRDSLHPAQPIATNSAAVLAPGQFSTVNGVAKISASSSTQQVIFTAIVHEKGALQDTNVSNNRGTITLDVFCGK